MLDVHLKEPVLRLRLLQPYPCHYCAKVWYTASAREAHHGGAHAREMEIRSASSSRNPPPDPDRPFKCDGCEKGSSAKTHLTRHFDHSCPTNKVNKQYNGPANKDKANDTRLPRPSNSNFFKCLHLHCGIKFSSSDLLEAHAVTHIGLPTIIECSVCAKRYSQKKGLNAHMKMAHGGEKPFECPACGKKYTYKFELKKHVATHSGEKPFACSICGKTLSTKFHLRRHRVTQHGVVDRHRWSRLFGCPACGKTFPLNGDLTLHLDSAHPGERLFECSTCAKTFRLKRDLQWHLGTHEEGKPLTCPTCGRPFRLRSVLNFHVRSHLGREERPFECTICGKTFNSKFNLKRHTVGHRGPRLDSEDVKPDIGTVPSSRNLHGCPACCQQFTRRDKLGSHLRGHREDSAFKCEICNCGFRTRKTLMTHITRNHTILGL